MRLPEPPSTQRGEAQIATVADIAFAHKMNEDPSLRIVASIGTSAGSRIVARRDRNIHAPSDLTGKKIGYSPGTSSDYFLQTETKDIIARKWKFSPEYVRYSWSRIRLDVSFNQSIITALQNYVKWQMDREGKTGDSPDVLSYLYTGALDEIDPKLVTIYR